MNSTDLFSYLSNSPPTTTLNKFTETQPITSNNFNSNSYLAVKESLPSFRNILNHNLTTTTSPTSQSTIPATLFHLILHPNENNSSLLIAGSQSYAAYRQANTPANNNRIFFLHSSSVEIHPSTTFSPTVDESSSQDFNHNLETDSLNTSSTELRSPLNLEIKEAATSKQIDDHIKYFTITDQDSEDTITLKKSGLNTVKEIQKDQEECRQLLESIKTKMQNLKKEHESAWCCFAPPPPRAIPQKLYDIVEQYTGKSTPAISEHKENLLFLEKLHKLYKDFSFEIDLFHIKRLVNVISVKFSNLGQIANCCYNRLLA